MVPGAWRTAASSLITCVSALAASSGWGAEPPPPRAVLEKDLKIFLGWLEGEFDNNEQVAFANELGISPDDVPERIHSIFKRVALPAFGEHVFYVEQYLDGNPAEIYRQRELAWTVTDARPAAVGLKIRRPVWPSGPNQDSLVLYVHDRASDNAERAVSYSWADPGAERIGINLRWMQASCSLHH